MFKGVLYYQEVCMLEFLPLENNLNILKRYLPYEKSGFCELSLGVKHAWRKVICTKYAVVDNTLILKESSPVYKNTFYYPLGENVNNALLEIENYCIQKGLPLLYCCLDQEQLSFLKNRYPNVQSYYDRDWSDYIYLAESFKTYSGKKLSGQRNHVNKFKKTYPTGKFKLATEKDIPRLIEFTEKLNAQTQFSSWTAKVEAQSIVDFLQNAFKLDQLIGYVEVDDDIVAFSMGERVNDYLIVHVEKALKEYQGAYPFVASEFAKAFATDGVKYINREEDCGDLGLRTSKTQYHPLLIKEKFYLKAFSPIDYINPDICLTAGDLTITAIKEQDKQDYYNLYVDEKLNELWGYDYKSDLNGKKPTPEYFYDFQNSLKEKREEFSFAVRLNGKMIGEIPLYNFDFFGGGEIGYRFFSEYQGKGYATISANAVKEYFFTVLNGKKLKTRCYKQNAKSHALIERLGFKLSRQDQTHFYFEMQIE